MMTHRPLRPGYAQKFPALAKRRQLPVPLTRGPDFSVVSYGTDMHDQPLLIDDSTRLMHELIVGTSGSGKSTHFKHVALQDIMRGRPTIVLDPHGGHPGSVYSELLAECDAMGFVESGRVHIIDPNIPGHVVPFNPLARFAGIDTAVIADANVQAVSSAWHGEDLHGKPTTRSMLRALFMALCELNRPFADCRLLLDPHDSAGARAHAIANLENEYARDELQRLHQISFDDRSKRDFRAEVIGPLNRLNEFTASEALRLMFSVVDEPGGPRRTFNLLEDILNRGGILLVNLQHGEAVSEANTDLLGAILLRSLLLLAPRRTNREPVMAHLDEAHKFMRGANDIPGLLAEARKNGIALRLGLQFEAQAGPRDELTYQALMNCTSIKTVMRIASPEEAQRYAEMLGLLTLERPVQASVRPTPVGHRTVRLASRSRHESSTQGNATSEGQTHSTTRSHTRGETVGDMVSRMEGTGHFDASGENAGAVMAPRWQLFGPNADNASLSPPILAESTGTSASRGTSRQSGTVEGTSHTTSETWGEATTRSQSRSTTRSDARTSGTADGESEAFETLYRNLPASFHSKENELYFLGEMIRRLPTGRAFVSCRGQTTLISIPPAKRKS